MNTWKRASAIGLAVLAFAACDKIDTKGSRELKSQKDKVSYGIGLDIGRSFKQQNLAVGDVDLDKLRIGIQDAMGGVKPLMSDSQLQETMMSFQKDMMGRQDSVNKKKGEENAKAAKEFFEKNAKEPGVVTTPSGLQYKVITEGKGPKPDSAATVTVHYVGTLLNGEEFDSSVKRGQPVSFPVGNVIKGWTEALQMMPVGSKWKLFIPPALGYGERGAGQKIGPNSALIFEVELLSLGDANKPAGAPGAPAGKPGAKPAPAAAAAGKAAPKSEAKPAASATPAAK
jgi:FKBP-type peptidyl-prolyl cis-trans isomerase